jgi:hypothetical protein|tara:strand:- start:425 stop:817 length:393 start_codon:yes stop_codon:yes gene_type:complete
MAKDIPDYLREYDLDQDWGFTPVSKAPESTPAVDTSVIETNNVELAKVKSDVGDIKSMMNEIMQIVAEKDKVTEALESEDVTKRFKEAEKLILPFLYNLMKSDEPYIHWPNRTPIIKAQIEKFLQITRGK